MKTIETIMADIRKGENVGLYFTIILSFVVGILSFFGVNQGIVTGIALAALGVLLSNILSTRKTITTLTESITRLDQKVGRLDENLPNKEFIESGLKDIHQSLPKDVLRQKFKNAKKEICILQSWIPEEVLLPELMDAVRSGVSLRILLLNPESEVASQRLEDVGYPRDSMRPIVMLEGLQVRLQKAKLTADQVEIRLYSSMPAFSLYSIDDWMLIGLFWHSMPTIKGPHLGIYGNSSVFGHKVIDTFDQVWKLATPWAFSFKLGQPANLTNENTT